MHKILYIAISQRYRPLLAVRQMVVKETVSVEKYWLHDRFVQGCKLAGQLEGYCSRSGLAGACSEGTLVRM